MAPGSATKIAPRLTLENWPKPGAQPEECSYKLLSGVAAFIFNDKDLSLNLMIDV
jgi:hypothetical protein